MFSYKTYFTGLGTTLVCALLLQDCRPTLSPNDVEAGIISVTAGCQFLTGLTQNQTVISICATVEEIAYIVSLFTPFFDGHPDAACVYLPGDVNCLSYEQVGTGIQAVVERRKERLLLDQ